MVKYFAYGSNMLTSRLRERVPSAAALGVAELEGYVLKFNKRSKDGSGKGNIESTKSGDGVVLGVIFEIEPTDLPELNRAEGTGYRCEWLDVVQGSERHEALTYVAVSDSIDDSLQPYAWYKDLVIARAMEHGLPNSYIEEIRQVPADEDPDEERDQKNRRILNQETRG